MRYLNSLDYTVIGIYCSVLLCMGIYLRRKAARSLEDYFLAGKQLPWWALGISGMTSFLDMAGTMLIVSFLYMLGPRGLFIEFRGGAVLVLAFMMLWMGKWHYRSRCMTGAEWNIYRFGSGGWAQAARILTAVAGIVTALGLLAYLIQGAGIFLSMFLPFSPSTCALMMVGLTTLYTMMSGFYGVVYTDMFQSGIILLSVVVISAMAVMKVSGYEGDLAELAFQVTGSPAWTSSVPHWNTPMPPGYQPYRYLAMFAGFYLLKNVLAGMGMGDQSQYFGARSERECGQLTFFWTWLMVFRWPMMMGFAVLGIFLVRDTFPDQAVVGQAAQIIQQSVGPVSQTQWVDLISAISSSPGSFPELASRLEALLGSSWAADIQLVSFQGTVNPERILPAVILTNIPAGLRGLFLVSLVAAAMSTFSPQVNMNTAFFTRDIYQAFLRPRAQNRELIAASYAFGVLLVVGGFAMAYSTKSINDIWGWIIMGLSGLAVPKLLRFYWWRFNAGGVVGGTAVGLLVAMVQRYVLPLLGPEARENVAFLNDERWQFLTFTLLSFAGAVAGTYLTRPTDAIVVAHFYRTTRPFGLWGPFKRLLPLDVRTAMEAEHRRDILAVPFALGWQVTLFLLPMQLIVGNFQAFAVTLVIFGLCLTGLIKIWYRHLPPVEPPSQRSASVAEVVVASVSAGQPAGLGSKPVDHLSG